MSSKKLLKAFEQVKTFLVHVINEEKRIYCVPKTFTSNSINSEKKLKFNKSQVNEKNNFVQTKYDSRDKLKLDECR